DLPVEVGRRAARGEERLALGPSRSRAGLGDRDAGALREEPRGLEELDPLAHHHELERVAARAAAEAVEELLRLVDVEGRGLLVVERAEAAVLAAGFLEGDRLGDEGDDVDGRPDLADEVGSARRHQDPVPRVRVRERLGASPAPRWNVYRGVAS